METFRDVFVFFMVVLAICFANATVVVTLLRRMNKHLKDKPHGEHKRRR
jgi:hypothetical protein